MIALALAGLAMTSALATAGWFLFHAKHGSMPRHQGRLGLGAGAALVLALAALVALAWRGGPVAAVAPMVVVALVGGVLFAVIYRTRRVPLGDLRVSEGDGLLPFRALLPDGSPFESSALRGERILLKFFRGQWCPFCATELKMFEALGPELAQHGVRVVALSKDPPADAARHAKRDGLTLTLLSDPRLEVIRAYGVEHHKAFELSKGPITFFGMPIGLVPRFEAMAVPTTLLIDEHGVIRWVDQSEDYKVRASRERVLGAVGATFGGEEVRGHDHP